MADPRANLENPARGIPSERKGEAMNLRTIHDVTPTPTTREDILAHGLAEIAGARPRWSRRSREPLLREFKEYAQQILDDAAAAAPSLTDVRLDAAALALAQMQYREEASSADVAVAEVMLAAADEAS